MGTTQDTAVLELEKSSLTLAERAGGLVIRDQAGLEQANEILHAGKEWEERVDAVFDPMRTRAYEAWQEVLKQWKETKAGWLKAKALLKGRVGEFLAEAERRRLAEAARLLAEQRKREDDARLAAAIGAEQAGMSRESVDQVLDSGTPLAPPAPAPVEKPQGLVSSEDWTAEVVDLRALIRAAAKDDKLLGYVEANEPAIRAAARTQKQALSLPGVRVFRKPRIAVR